MRYGAALPRAHPGERRRAGVRLKKSPARCWAEDRSEWIGMQITHWPGRLFRRKRLRVRPAEEGESLMKRLVLIALLLIAFVTGGLLVTFGHNDRLDPDDEPIRVDAP